MTFRQSLLATLSPTSLWKLSLSASVSKTILILLKSIRYWELRQSRLAEDCQKYCTWPCSASLGNVSAFDGAHTTNSSWCTLQHNFIRESKRHWTWSREKKLQVIRFYWHSLSPVLFQIRIFIIYLVKYLFRSLWFHVIEDPVDVFRDSRVNSGERFTYAAISAKWNNSVLENTKFIRSNLPNPRNSRATIAVTPKIINLKSVKANNF